MAEHNQRQGIPNDPGHTQNWVYNQSRGKLGIPVKCLVLIGTVAVASTYCALCAGDVRALYSRRLVVRQVAGRQINVDINLHDAV